MSLHRKRNKVLGLPELIAIALGGMVGGGIFTILGISAALIGNLTPVAIIIGGLVAALAAYSYIKLGVYYKDEGATYAFYKKTFPGSAFSASAIGWFVIFGYISTLALYAYTFSSYAISSTSMADNTVVRKIVAIAIIGVFMLINIWSVNGMGKTEDIMVYTKLCLLMIISCVLIYSGRNNLGEFTHSIKSHLDSSGYINILIVASITFVAYEGFQLVINAVNEMDAPEKNIPRAIYSAVALAILIYVVISFGALLSIPLENLIKNKEFALAAGAGDVLGSAGVGIVIASALLATASAISGTLFGSSRQMAAIADDGYMPAVLSKRKNKIPVNSIVTMSIIASTLIAVGGLELILEFGSITFILVSLLMAVANHKIRHKTNSSDFITIAAITGLGFAGILILYFKLKTQTAEMVYILVLYLILSLLAWYYSKKKSG